MSIVRDNASASQFVNPGSSLTWEHICSVDANLLLVAVHYNAGAENLIGVTYAGVPLSRLPFQSSDGPLLMTFYLIAPATGANDVVVSFSSGDAAIRAYSVSYEGARQYGFPDAFGVADSYPNPLVMSLTTLVDNCWMYGHSRNSYGDPVVGDDTVFLGADPGNECPVDSDGPFSPAGVHSLNLILDPASFWAVFLSIAPDIGGPSIFTRAATDIGLDAATLNGEVTDIGGSDVTERGFVWGTTSLPYPGNVAPASAGYDGFETESGTFIAEPYSYPLASLLESTTYFVRAYALNGAEYAYGEEISFVTGTPAPFRFTNLAGIVFDEADTQTIYAERLNNMLERIEALEG